MAKGITFQVGRVTVPPWVVDHPSFLRWFRSGDVPEDARITYVNDTLWVDPMSERAFAHNKVKTAVAYVLYGLIEGQNLGQYFGDGMVYTNEDEQFTTVPDGMFVSREAVEAGRVWLTGGERSEGDTELVGVPNLVIEVVSPNSEDKDTVWLMAKYWAAGIPEYWVIDGREEPLKFTIYRHGRGEYKAVRKTGGWAKSAVLGRSFRFVPGEKVMGHPTYGFEMR
ncbi:Uma2 family endonuclease [bacterium]|nr:Uma2 family endonuclease [bacterium]